MGEVVRVGNFVQACLAVLTALEPDGTAGLQWNKAIWQNTSYFGQQAS